MATRFSPLLLLLLLGISSATAFDVMEILQPYTEYSTFTKYLTDLKLVDAINGRQTVTVLVVDDTALSAFFSLSGDDLKKAISYHILLDYYDPYILDRNFDKAGIIPSMGGNLKYNELAGEKMVFGVDVAGAPQDCSLIKVVGARPYNLSVLEVSKAITTTGGAGGASFTNAPPAGTPPTPASTDKATPNASSIATVAPTAAPNASSGASTAPVEAPKSIGAEATNGGNTTTVGGKTESPAAAEAPKSSGDSITSTTAKTPAAAEAPKSSGSSIAPTTAEEANGSGSVSSQAPKSSNSVSSEAPQSSSSKVPVASEAPKSSSSVSSEAPKSSPSASTSQAPTTSEAPTNGSSTSPKNSTISSAPTASEAPKNSAISSAPTASEAPKTSTSSSASTATEAPKSSASTSAPTAAEAPKISSRFAPSGAPKSSPTAPSQAPKASAAAPTPYGTAPNAAAPGAEIPTGSDEAEGPVGEVPLANIASTPSSLAEAPGPAGDQASGSSSRGVGMCAMIGFTTAAALFQFHGLF